MTLRLRMLVLLARPSVLIIFGLFAATGLAQAGAYDDSKQFAHVLVAVSAFTLFCVIVNDLADRAIDEVNLPGDRRRPLATGTATSREFVVMALTAAAVALVSAVVLSWQAAAVVAGGMALSAGYSLRPVRIADRGALAALLLPMGYVAVPYLVGIADGRNGFEPNDLLVGAALYIGFIGRILLKDFRDVRGDTLFGKRTFLVRHGRRWTCAFSAVCWVAGASTLAFVRGCTPALVLGYAAHVALALGLLRALSDEGGARRDDRLISAIALVGRSAVVILFAHLSMTSAGWSAAASGSVVGALTVLGAGQAWVMVRFGPAEGRRRRWRVENTVEEPSEREVAVPATVGA